MHGGKSGVLIELCGHSLEVNEFHSGVLGLIGLVFGEWGKAIRTILDEPWYFVVVFVVSYFVGSRYRHNNH